MNLKDFGVMQQSWNYGALVGTGCHYDIRCFDQAIRRVGNETERAVPAPQLVHSNATANRGARTKPV
jgi:hypothetical protein